MSTTARVSDATQFTAQEAQALQEQYAAVWQPAMYQDLMTGIEKNCIKMGLRVAEHPVFLPSDLRDKAFSTALDLTSTLHARKAPAALVDYVPPAYRTPTFDTTVQALPHVMCVDFAVTRTAGELDLRLIELQAGPNHYFQNWTHFHALQETLKGLDGFPTTWGWTANDLSDESYIGLLRDCICGDHPVEDCALVDVRIAEQKTNAEFNATQKILGIAVVDAKDLTQVGRKLYRPNPADGAPIEVKRVYYRIVADDVKDPLPFDIKTLDTEFWPRPEEQFLWAKASMASIQDKSCVPQTLRVCDAKPDLLAGDLSGYVLKPLLSFSGQGVDLNPTAQTISLIPEDQRKDWCLQQKVEYAHWIQAAGPESRPVGTELRVLLVRRDGDAEMAPLNAWMRCSDGKMFNVGFNKKPGLGVSVGMWPKDAVQAPQ